MERYTKKKNTDQFESMARRKKNDWCTQHEPIKSLSKKCREKKIKRKQEITLKIIR